MEGSIKILMTEIVEAIREIKIGKAPGPSEVLAEIIRNGDVIVRVSMELYQKILDGKRIPLYWAMSTAVHKIKLHG